MITTRIERSFVSEGDNMVKIIYTDKLTKGTYVQIDGILYEGVRQPTTPPITESKKRIPILQTG